MQVPGSLYGGKENRRYLAVYTVFPDVYRAAPPSAKDAVHVIHGDYSYQAFRRGLDVFYLPSELSLDEVQVKRVIHERTDPKTLATADITNDVKYQALRLFPYIEEALNLTRQDIYDFCKNPATEPTGTSIEYVDAITPRTELKIIHPEFLLMGGKQEFVPSCGLEANLDLSYGCISGIVNGFLDVYAECTYCYAIYNHKTFSKYIVHIDKQHLIEELRGGAKLNGGDGEELGRLVNILRFGKRTESGSKITKDSLKTSLEALIETGTRGVIPTKYLEYDRETAELLKRSKSLALFSRGWDELEKGACSNGCNNEFRLEQAIKYKEAGAPTAIYLLIDLPHAPKKRELDVLKTAREHNIPVQLLSIRIPSGKVAQVVTGMSWESLKMDINAEQLAIPGLGVGSIGMGGYQKKAGTLIAQEKHPYWLNMVGNNNGMIRMCHHDEKETYCGGCFQRKGFIIPTEHVNVEYKKVRPGNWKRRKMDAWYNGKQLFPNNSNRKH